MPFDGTDSPETHPLAKLGAVERLLANEQQWCKGRLRDVHGRHCLVGAIEAVDGRQILQRIILHAAREVTGKRYWRIEFFNDDPRTTYADVLEVLRHARENINAGMMCDPQPWHRRLVQALRALRSRSRCDSGKALRRTEGGHRPLADQPAVLYRDVYFRAYADGDARKERAVVMELQD